MPFGQKQRRQAGKRLQFHRVFKIIPNIAQILFGYAVFPSGKHHGLFAFGGFFECLSLFFGYLLPSQLTVHVVAVAPKRGIPLRVFADQRRGIPNPYISRRHDGTCLIHVQTAFPIHKVFVKRFQIRQLRRPKRFVALPVQSQQGCICFFPPPCSSTRVTWQAVYCFSLKL